MSCGPLVPADSSVVTPPHGLPGFDAALMRGVRRRHRDRESDEDRWGLRRAFAAVVDMVEAILRDQKKILPWV
jgi:hypothetical protein